MEGLVQPDRLRDRILIWTEEEIHARHSAAKVRSRSSKPSSIRGELPRGEVAAMLGTGERQARRDHGSPCSSASVLTSRRLRAIPLHLAFPAKLALPLDAGAVSGARPMKTRQRSGR